MNIVKLLDDTSTPIGKLLNGLSEEILGSPLLLKIVLVLLLISAIILIIIIIVRLLRADEISYGKFKLNGGSLRRNRDKREYKEKIEQLTNALRQIGDVTAELAGYMPCNGNKVTQDEYKKGIDQVYQLTRHIILDLLPKKSRSDTRRFCLLEPTEKDGATVLKMAYAVGFATEVQKSFELNVGAHDEGVGGACFRQKKSKIIADISKDNKFNPENYDADSIKSLLCVPILVRDKSVALVNIDSSIKGAFDNLDRIIVEAIARLWAIVYELKQCPHIGNENGESKVFAGIGGTSNE